MVELFNYIQIIKKQLCKKRFNTFFSEKRLKDRLIGLGKRDRCAFGREALLLKKIKIPFLGLGLRMVFF